MFRKQIYSQVQGITRVRTSLTKIKGYLLPLPPFEEQKRIVAKIEELMPYADEYDKANIELGKLNEKFPEDMQKSILQYAIQGKLVEQREEEGTAEELYHQIQVEKEQLVEEGKIKKQKKLPEITEEEIPFDIPKSWKWVRINEIASFIKAGGDKPKEIIDQKNSYYDVPVIGNGKENNGIVGYTTTPTVEVPCLTVSGRGTIGYTCYRSEPFTPIVRLIVLNFPSGISNHYIEYVLTAPLEKGVGTSIKQLTVPMIKTKLVPLPPIEEQKRIVAKIEDLEPYTERLE
ncbi:restriction endonuclease S subunit [Salibacterium salarium]|nr:restriction endonuclease S subunit [Salibacterium salarium]